MNRRIYIIVFIALLAGAGSASGDKAAAFNKKGIDAYRNKRYEESMKQFTEALIERPKTPELRFNRGTALSAMGKKDEAVNELAAAAGSLKTKERSAAAQYNAGNALFSANDFKGALGRYMAAVKLDQQSRDIRHNLELAVRKMTDQKKPPSNKDPKNKEEQKNDSQKNKTPRNKQQQKMEQQQSQQKNSDMQPMTKEEAERLLDAMTEDEKKSLSLRNMQTKSVMRAVDDW